MSVLLLFLFLIVQCSDGRISSDGKIKDNVSTQMEIEREMVLLRFARKEKGVDVRRLLVYATSQIDPTDAAQPRTETQILRHLDFV